MQNNKAGNARPFRVHLSSCLFLAPLMALSLFAPPCLAADKQPIETQPPATDFGATLLDVLNNNTDPGPLSKQGKMLHDWGLTPTLNMVEIVVGNPSSGYTTGKHEAVSIFTAGLDADLQKLVGFNGAFIHSQYLFVPPPYHNGDTWGTFSTDAILGNVGPYIPAVSHLTMLTWEQKLFNDKLDIEVGESNPQNYFAKPLCNQGFLCQTNSLQNGVGFAPPPYANYMARIAYSFTSEITAQGGFWRSNSAYPFTSGYQGWGGTVWDSSGNKIVDPNSNLLLGNIVYQTKYETDPYPKYYEAMFYYNDAVQAGNTNSTGYAITGVPNHKGTTGMYFGAKQTIWRPDGGILGVSHPMAISAYGSLYASFDQHSTTGIEKLLQAGLVLEAPFVSRPLDSYSLSFTWNQLTQSEQAYLLSATSVPGSYTVGRNEFAVKADANFFIAGGVIAQPYVLYTFNTNDYQYVMHGGLAPAGNPKNGVGAGIVVVVLLDRLLGL